MVLMDKDIPTQQNGQNYSIKAVVVSMDGRGSEESKGQVNLGFCSIKFLVSYALPGINPPTNIKHLNQ